MNTIKPAHVRPTPCLKVEHHFSCFVFCKSASLCSAACHFAQPNAGEIILNAVKKGHLIPQNCQLKIFGLPNAPEVALEYVRHGYWFCDEAQKRIPELPNADEIFAKLDKQK